MNNKYDIAIAYRIYPLVSKIPAIFADSKYELSKLCLKSFRNAIEGIKPRIWIILDKCPVEYEKLFADILDGLDYEFIKVDGLGNGKTFKLQMDILLKQDYSENIYFAEDDYFYLPDSFKTMLNFLKSEFKTDFITPYDHPDYYNYPIHNYIVETIRFESQDWRSSGSTCMTFLTTKETLRKTYWIFNTYAYRNWDYSLWLALTRNKVTNPIFGLKSLFTNFYYFKIFAKAWIYNMPQIIFGRKYYLWSPKPSLATHMDGLHLAPEIDWQQLFTTQME